MSDYDLNIPKLDLGIPQQKEKKRKTLTSAQRIYIWEHPNLYGRKCHICGQRITKLSDLELDHRRAYSKGGSTLALAHKDCNRVKSNKSLGQIQKLLGLKTKKKVKARASKPKKRRSSYPSSSVLNPNFKLPEVRIPKISI